MRLFVSDVEDKPWFYDREMWPRYLAMLAANRFTRFNLSFGIGYDFLRGVTDAYLLFAYPFLLDVPGYKVRAVEAAGRRARPQSRDAAATSASRPPRAGLEFQLGIWMHGYQWENSPHPNYTIEGLDGGEPRPVLPRRADRAAAGLPGRSRRHPAHPRRERRGRGQLRVLEDASSTA